MLFVAVVEEESIGRAAERCGIAASAVSKRISLLEQSLGVELLVRHRRGVEPTAAGLVVLRRARAMLHEAAQLRAELREVRAGLRGRVQIVANETALIHFLPSRLAGFAELHPGVEIALEEQSSAGVVRGVWQNSADFGIYTGDVPPIDLWRQAVFRDRLVVVLRPDHPLASAPAATMAAILAHQVVGQRSMGALAGLLNRSAAAHGRVLQMQLFVDGYAPTCALVAEHGILGIVSESAARTYAPAFGLAILPIADDWAERSHQICARSLRDLNAAARAVLDHILRAKREDRSHAGDASAIANGES